MRWLLSVVGIVVCGLVVLQASAFAHVLIREEIYGSGATLHITPNDDPVAGQSSTLYYELKGGSVTTDNFVFSLHYTDESSTRTEVPVTQNGSTGIQATITFPYQGVYKLELSASPRAGGSATTFAYAQRVDRGTARVVSGGSAATTKHTWAEAVAILAASAIAAILIISINRWRAIVRYSGS